MEIHDARRPFKGYPSLVLRIHFIPAYQHGGIVRGGNDCCGSFQSLQPPEQKPYILTVVNRPLYYPYEWLPRLLEAVSQLEAAGIGSCTTCN